MQNLVFLIIGLFSCVFADLQWTSCGSPEDLFELRSLTYSPTNIVRGKDLVVTLEGDLKEEVSFGLYASLRVKFGFISIPIPNVDLCEALENSNSEYTCPIPAGSVKTTIPIRIPKATPVGTYNVILKILDENDRQLGCFNVKAAIGSSLTVQ